VPSGLNMSKQELTKWKNKFKIWKCLHHEPLLLRHCGDCVRKGRDCGGLKTLMYNIYTDEAEYSTVCQQNGHVCIEWIINV